MLIHIIYLINYDCIDEIQIFTATSYLKAFQKMKYVTDDLLCEMKIDNNSIPDLSLLVYDFDSLKCYFNEIFNFKVEYIQQELDTEDNIDYLF